MRATSLLIFACIATCAGDGPPFFPPPSEGFGVQSRWTPEQAGLTPTVIEQLEPLAARWALWRYGRLIHVKGDFNQTSDVASNRKTWHAMIVGVAILQGKIPSLQQKISVWNKELSGKDAEATWWHVITQSSGFDYPYGNFRPYKPGEMWTYSDLNLIQLCDALARVWGKKDHRDGYEEVARQAFFDAIGMRGWRTGYSKEDDGIRFILDLEDMGRLGLLACNRGTWNGQQLVPEWFVRELETKQTRGMKVNYDGPNDGKVGLDPAQFPEAPYGYLTWVNTDGDLYPGADRAWTSARGAGGHLTLWNYKYGIVFAAAGWIRPPRERDAPQIIEANLKK